MALFTNFLRSKEAVRGQAIVVDLANIRVPVPPSEKILINNELKDPFRFEYIRDIRKDIENLGLVIPIFYLLDTQVTPDDMTEEEKDGFLDLTSSSVLEESHVWRVGRTHQKADYVICDLINELDALIITGDRFDDHIASGRIVDRKRMLRFAPKRASKGVPHVFVNRGHGDKRARPQDLLDLPTTDEEYWQRWDAHAAIIMRWLDPVAAEFAAAQMRGERPVRVGALEPSAVGSVVAQGHSVGGTSKAPPTSRGTKGSRAARPATVPRILCSDYWGLNHHLHSWVQVVGRVFRQNDGFVLRDFAAARGVDILDAPKMKGLATERWISCTGILGRDSEGYFLESAEWAPPRELSEITSAYAAERARNPIRYTQWGSMLSRVELRDENREIDTPFEELHIDEGSGNTRYDLDEEPTTPPIGDIVVESAEDNLDQGHTEAEKVDEAPRDPDVGGESAAETTGDGSPVTTVAASGEVVEEDQRSQGVVTSAPTSVAGLDTSPGDSHQSGRRNRTPVVAVSAVALAIIVAAMLLFA